MMRPRLVEASSTHTYEAPLTSPSLLGAVGAAWGVIGVVLLIGNAVVRLTPRALASMQMDLGPLEWLALVGCVVTLAYTEGYKSFQLAFSPRVVARAVHLARRPVWWHVLLAPAFCMGYFHATRKRMIVAWVLTTAIVGLIVAVSYMAMPWRGFVDAGVVVALSWGVVAIVYFAVRAVLGHALPVPPDLPGSA